MKYAVVYSSQTGNTARLAREIRAALPAARCVYSGPPDEKALDAPLIFAGFWTDKGGCAPEMQAFLERLRGKRVFLFGTAGFGGSEDYFARILGRVEQCLDGSNTVAGRYMCQGRMPPAVRRRYEAMLPAAPEKARALLENFDRALPHPNEEDLAGLRRAAAACAGA